MLYTRSIANSDMRASKLQHSRECSIGSLAHACAHAHVRACARARVRAHARMRERANACAHVRMHARARSSPCEST
eukprot:6175570-Pleurochrysis_carterae.AAC.2